MSSTRKIDREQFRYQTLETQIGIDSAVRDIDNFVESLDLEKLGFKVEKWSNTGRPAAADAKDLLKLFIYGAMNNIQSTRELERHCALNIEIIWLIYGQRPGHSIIASFRSENKACFAAVFEILADRILAWIGIGFQSLDGSKIRASNSKDANFTLSKIDDRIENLKKRIDEARRKAQKIDETYELPEQPETKVYIPKSKKQKETQKTQGQLSLFEDDSKEKDKADELEESLPDDDDDDDDEDEEDDDLSRLKKSIEERQKRLAKYLGYRDYMEKHNLSQLSLTDPDSKLMKSKNGYIVSYNVQMTVDSESQILSTICMTNNPTDMSLIYRTLKGLKARYPNQILHVTADKGYTVTEDMAECLENGIVPHVIMEDGTDFYTVQFPYEPCEVTEEKLQSEKTDDIKQCLRSGRIPQVYSKHLSNVVVKEKKIYDIDISGYRENMTEEEMKQLASCGFFVRDIARDRVYCPAKIILRRKSVKANDTVRYANKLGCAKCEARKQGYCTKSKFKEIDFPEKKTVKECQNWMPVEYVDVEEKTEGTETDEKKVVPGDEGESLESVKIREKENVEAGKKKAESEDGGSSSEERKSEAKGSSDKGKTNEYKQIVKRKVVGTRMVVEMRLTPSEQMTSERFSLSEHPFGTIKEYMNRDKVYTRGIEGADADVQISGIGYNMIRAGNLFARDIRKKVLRGEPKPDDYVYTKQKSI